ncbi:hypothetical protein EVAR_86833_1 [Eumeta japonica]|uniref:Uncharacterized protein n=1 Tax=Eumeta variegata TaxID=151549 RepID=A0A4C1VT36_EUMVA|nr:hypothetical protein EVAR_86833_1 [Eumeta japonica]
MREMFHGFSVEENKINENRRAESSSPNGYETGSNRIRASFDYVTGASLSRGWDSSQGNGNSFRLTEDFDLTRFELLRFHCTSSTWACAIDYGYLRATKFPNWLSNFTDTGIE